ncbi:S8 family serine peptidase [Nocardioides sp. NPDC059952]|uniref:S8 family serine peptidase n=1 Tax=Nocardioides sp. NPDC059952 TaxID=3347014 RepID=UPI0036594F65
MNRIGRSRLLTTALSNLESQLPADLEVDDEDARAVLKFRAGSRISTGPLSRLRFVPLGEDEEWTYYVLSSRESRLALQALIAEYGNLPDGAETDVDWDHPKSWAGLLDNLEGVELYGREDRADVSLADLAFDPTTVVDVLLWPSGRQATTDQRIASVRALLDGHPTGANGDGVLAIDPRPDRTVVRVSVDEGSLEKLLDHADVERVRAPLQAAISQEQLTRFTAPARLPEAADTAIGLVDGVVVTTNPMIEPYVIATSSFPTGHVFTGADDHGTYVGGCAIWGDLDVAIARDLPEPFPIVSARVLEPRPGPSGDMRVQVVGIAHQTIEEAIRWLVVEHGVRVICMSIAHPEPAKTALRNELTLTVDQLARELDVVIVVAAGNRTIEPATGWLGGYPSYVYDSDAGVASPGDGAIMVTVGSIAKRSTAADRYGDPRIGIAGANDPSPFTRTGPVRGRGATGSMKPEFADHGGNWAIDPKNHWLDPLNPGTSSVVTIPPRSGRIVGPNNGTSFAAPKVAREIARIGERYPDASANLLRALAALSATTVANGRGAVLDRRVAAYGQPDADRVLESTAQRVFLTFEGDTNTGRITLHRLPIPPAFADGRSRKVFRVALAFDPPVRRQRREYIAGSMSVELVRGISFERVQEIYSRQPTRAQVDADPKLTRMELPDSDNRPPLTPGTSALSSNTMIRRDFVDGAWDPDHNDYVLVVRHDQSPWSESQRRAYDTQSYALAVEIADETRTDIDLYSLIRARLSQRIRVGRR